MCFTHGSVIFEAARCKIHADMVMTCTCIIRSYLVKMFVSLPRGPFLYIWEWQLFGKYLNYFIEKQGI